jgi:hypothetical protein
MRCAEPTCRKTFKPYRERDRFHSRSCARTYHNRQAMRGAKIVPLLLAWLRKRNQITFIAQEVRAWRDEDKRLAEDAEAKLALSSGYPRR